MRRGDKYPFLQSGWTQAEILQAGQILEKKLSEAEGLRLVPFLSEPGVPADVALRILKHTAMFKPAQRARLLDDRAMRREAHDRIDRPRPPSSA